MITRVHKGGPTFGGLARYLTRDDRHAAIETENLSSRDARTSARIMQAVANTAPLLKQLAGGSARGRPLKKPAHHFTGSWAPDENPSDEEMFAFGRRCLKALGFEDRQAVMVIHRDKTYRGQVRHELHVMTNRVSFENGLAAPDDDDAIKLSNVAKLHEKEQGRIYIRSRFKHRPSAELERKRMRLPDGTTTPMTAFERAEFAAKKREHREQRTPVQQRRAELTHLGRDVGRLRRLRERADRLEGLAVVVPVPAELPPRPERPRADLAQVRIENPAPAAALPPVELPPRPERPRADLAQVRIENPAPAAALPPVELPPRPERPRADLAQVRIENPAPAAALPPVELPPRPERPRADLAQVRIENPAPAGALPPVELPPRPERPRVDQVLENPAPPPPPRPDDERQPDEAEAARAAVRAFDRAAMTARDYETPQVAADLVASQSARLPAWDPVEAELVRRQATEDRYTERMDIGHGFKVDVGVRRMDLEWAIFEHAKSGRSRVPPARPATLGATITAAVEAIQKAADRLVNRILGGVLGRGDPAPAAATLTAPEHGAAPTDEQPSAQGEATREGAKTGRPSRQTTTREDGHDASAPPLAPGVNVAAKADEAPDIDRGDGREAGGVDKAAPPTPAQNLSHD